ncbi:MAG: hypothetical protein Q9180_004207 [Flavoplaca navasiana]
MSNSQEMVDIPRLQLSVEQAQTGTPEAMMGRIVACGAIVTNYTMLLKELMDATNFEDTRVKTLWIESLATMSGYVHRWWEPLYQSFKDARFDTADGGFQGKGTGSQEQMRRLREIFGRFDDAVETVVSRIQDSNPAQTDLDHHFTASIDNLEAQYKVSRRSPSEIGLQAMMLTWYRKVQLQQWKPGNNTTWRDYARAYRRGYSEFHGSDGQQYQLFKDEKGAGLPKTVGVVWLPTMGIRTSGTLTEFTKYLNFLALQGTNETTRVWFTALRQGRFTPKEQAYLDQRIRPLKTKYDLKLATNAAGLDGPAMTQKKKDTLREIFIEEASLAERPRHWHAPTIPDVRLQRRNNGNQVAVFLLPVRLFDGVPACATDEF